jgi:hypothetical protein
MYYFITPTATGDAHQELALAVDKNHDTAGLIVMAKADGDLAQYWLPIMAPNGGFMLLSGYSDRQGQPRLAYAPKNGHQVQQIALSEDSMHSDSATWTIGETGLTKCAIRPHRDSDMNLNVRGDGPYKDGNHVIIHGWGGGDANERWTFVPVL